MSELIKEITSETEFSAAIRSGAVLVDFFAPWCGPCKMQGPILEQVAADMGGKATIIKVDTDKNGDLAQKFEVSSIPTLILFKDGQAIDRLVGLQQAATLKTALENAAS